MRLRKIALNVCLSSCVAMASAAFSVTNAQDTQSPKQDMKDAGHATKDAAKDTGACNQEDCQENWPCRKEDDQKGDAQNRRKNQRGCREGGRQDRTAVTQKEVCSGAP